MPVSPPADPPLTRRIGFAPVVDGRTRLLILGSLPGDASLAAVQYYAHPRNAFWRLTGGVIGRDLTALPYAARLEALKTAGIGLWDVITTAHRAGSLDTAIRDPEFADLPGLIATLPQLRAVAFNGKTAARSGRRILSGLDGRLTLIDLPSSSPAHARPLQEKAQGWAILKAALGD
tara:strand:- start:881 stop:1408 length:528 start_codon:yes stop_codon:yes gene_type:complete